MYNSFLGNINAPLICKKGLRPIEDEADIINSSTYFSIFQRVLMISARRFKWKGLPEGVPDWWIETNLFYYDKIAAYEDNRLGSLILPAFNADAGNIYYMPQKYNIFGLNYNKTVDADKLEVLWNNYLGTSMIMILDPLISNVYESTRARDVNIFNNKIPAIYKTSKAKELSMRNIFNRIRRNIPATMIEELSDIDSLQVMNTNVPYIVGDLDQHINHAWNEIYSVLGIKSSQIEKRERVQTSEVAAANEQTIMHRQIAIETRERFCEKVNKKFGWNLSVEWTIKEDINDGEIYNDAMRYAQNNTVV